MIRDERSRIARPFAPCVYREDAIDGMRDGLDCVGKSVSRFNAANDPPALGDHFTTGVDFAFVNQRDAVGRNG